MCGTICLFGTRVHRRYHSITSRVALESMLTNYFVHCNQIIITNDFIITGRKRDHLSTLRPHPAPPRRQVLPLPAHRPEAKHVSVDDDSALTFVFCIFHFLFVYFCVLVLGHVWVIKR